MAVRTEVSVVRAMEGKARRARWKRPTSSAARCCESAALPPLPHHRILFPASRQSVMRAAARSKASSCATNWRMMVRCSAIASAKTPDKFNDAPAFYALAAVEFGLRAWTSRRPADPWLSILSAAFLTATKVSDLPLLLPWALVVFPLLLLL